MANTEINEIAPDTLETASAWFARLHSGDATDQDIEDHMVWLLEAPENANAYEQVAMAMREAGLFEQAARALFPAEQPAATGKTKEKAGSGWFSSWAWPQWSVVATAAAVLMFAVLTTNEGLFAPTNPAVSYIAYGSSVKSYDLNDGSTVSLFAGSEIRANFKSDERAVELVRGRAFFDVTTDASRPFTVAAGDRLVTVVGTRFEVTRGDGFERVAVNEGLVSVASSKTPDAVDSAILIEPGISATYLEDTRDPKVVKTDASTIGIWSEGVLPFEKTALPEVIDTIQALFPNKKLQLEDTTLSEMEFSGTLAVTDATKMMQQLSIFLDLKVMVAGDVIALMPK